MPAQQIVILADEESSGTEGGMPAIGPRKEVVAALAKWNTAPAQKGEDVLYGPGYRIEMAPGQDPLTQMLLTIDDEDIAWAVLMRLAKSFRWKLLDPMTGRELKPH